MRVAIDARKLHDFGIGTYIRNLLRHLARIDAASEYVLLAAPADLDVAGTLAPNFRAVLEDSPNYSVREQWHVPWVLLREKPDVFHAPHYVLPKAVPCRSVVTIHDCIHLMFPQYLRNRAAYAYARGSMWIAAHKADRRDFDEALRHQRFQALWREAILQRVVEGAEVRREFVFHGAR